MPVIDLVAAREILEYLRDQPETSRAEVAGSFRRGKETVHDLDFLVASKHPKAIMEAFVAPPWVESVIASGPTKTSVRLHSGVQCDLRVVTNAEFPFALAYFTGSKEHNILLRARALKQGWTLNEYRFAPTGPDSPEVPGEIYEEAQIHRSLGLEFIDPALRDTVYFRFGTGNSDARAVVERAISADRRIESAMHDPLTGLLNRTAMTMAVSRARAGDAIALLDLDELPQENTTP